MAENNAQGRNVYEIDWDIEDLENIPPGVIQDRGRDQNRREVGEQGQVPQAREVTHYVVSMQKYGCNSCKEHANRLIENYIRYRYQRYPRWVIRWFPAL